MCSLSNATLSKSNNIYVREYCPEKILSTSMWLICLRSVWVTDVEKETDRAKDRQREVDGDPADS